MMVVFLKIDDSFWPLTIFGKNSIVDVWQGSKTSMSGYLIRGLYVTSESMLKV